jgi:hypothetical protein
MNSNNKKADQLGMPVGTASNRLRKSIIFMLLKKLNLNFCHQCGGEIESEKELSIEHKIPYLDSADPVKLFFDLDNIAFSHLDCNIKAARKTYADHGTENCYYRGCRCDKCTEKQRIKKQKYRLKKASSPTGEAIVLETIQ